MSGSDDRDTRLTRRQRLIESLNAKEAELSESQGGRSSRPSEGETEVEKERQRNLSRRGFA